MTKFHLERRTIDRIKEVDNAIVITLSWQQKFLQVQSRSLHPWTNPSFTTIITLELFKIIISNCHHTPKPRFQTTNRTTWIRTIVALVFRDCCFVVALHDPSMSNIGHKEICSRALSFRVITTTRFHQYWLTSCFFKTENY